ncbi:Pre-mRNA-splicing factor SYF1 [Gracilariopsis chorda]|uniref:Pre-mRNA-splicing factor SYF1 n=1 Tax=Gracilariopsis chorda TaxID=448386 RepID=A0A2V3IJ26_9FLOR|nr:Pre-mRNA-splicing factor SYF1 [Gracilariopsis chorda]|eukprot:PXF42071.1 Pre-mRNA-splicing factor SYF1 [Gracilariopsis chorda]
MEVTTGVRSAATLSYEEDVLRNPFSPRRWLEYLAHLSRHTAKPTSIFPVYERAVAALPGSYKIWYQYSQTFWKFAIKNHPDHPSREASLSISHRAALALKRSPVLWNNYISRLVQEKRFTRARQAINESLQLLPITQHFHIWDIVTDQFLEAAPPRTCVLLLRRFAKLEPSSGRERLFLYMVKARMWDDAVRHLAMALSDESWEPEEETRDQLWTKLAKVAAKHGSSVRTVDVPQLLRSGIADVSGEKGELWISLAHYHTRKADFDRARQVYEEAVTSLNSVKDFALVFDAYAKFQESLISAAIDEMEGMKEDRSDAAEIREAEGAIDSLMEHLEFLTKRRPMLLSDVWLRQNPHNVHEWHKRARMYKQEKDAVNVVNTYTRAIQTVDPWRASNGRSQTLWLAFARYYEDAKDLSSARSVLEKAVENPDGFRRAEDLAAVWCEYAEMELRCSEPARSLDVLRRAVEIPEQKRQEELGRKQGAVQSNVEAALTSGAGNVTITHEYDKSSPAWNAYKSKRLWHFLLDLSHSFESEKEVMKLHNRMLELRIASPQTILSGCAYLESKRLFEQAFRLYDTGCASIPWPDALQIWVVYLTRFVKRYGSKKLERARDLFEEAIRTAPSTKKANHVFPHPQLRVLYLMYADMEDKHSLARHALNVLARACRDVREEDRPDIYRFYIVKTASLFGVTKTRPIYEEAMSSLRNPGDVIEFASRYAAMEATVGEFDRARAIFVQSCHIVDTRARGVYEMFWKNWNDFELAHGSEDTYTDMLRHKRDVQLNSKGVPADIEVLMSNQEGIRNMVLESGEPTNDQ